MNPKPLTREAMLWSDDAQWFTLHFYVETVPVVVDGESAWEHVFECIRTGKKRRWGLDHRDELN